MRVYHNTESYVNLVSKIHKNKYDYSKTVFVDMKTPITVVCPEHGEFYPRAGNHKRTGCPGCYEGRRGNTIRMTQDEFVERLKAHNPKLSLHGEFVSASDKVKISCSDHGSFLATPTRVLQYPFSCPKCAQGSIDTKRAARNKGRVAAAIAGLPPHISVTTTSPGWDSDSVFRCEYHGEFTNTLARAVQQQYVCNECSKEHLRGVARVSYEDYAEAIAKMYPTPPYPITLDKEAYLRNVGTREVLLHCQLHGQFIRNRSTINNKRGDSPCPSCKTYGSSDMELEVLSFLRQFDAWEQGNRSALKGKEIDCFSPKRKLGVEFCGLYWHSELKLDKAYHRSKLEACEEQGIGLIQIFEDEWLNHRDICESLLKNRLGVTQYKYHARKLTVAHIDFSTARDFLEANHIQGFNPSQYYYGLYDKSDLVAVASFSLNRLKKDGMWELVRYSSKLNSTVVGGLSKLCKHFMRKHDVDSLLSYCCLRWFSGAGYEASGFKLIGRTQPTYFYTNKIERISRYSATKQKLSKRLPDFDANLTEHENMSRAGFTRIFDCGHNIYVLNR